MGNISPIPVTSTSEEQKKLLQAIRTRNIDAVRKLLSDARKERVNEIFASTADMSTACHVTPLLAAVKYNSKEIVELLLQKGADASFVDDMGWTALLYASHNEHNNPDIVELLCSKSVSGQNYITHLGYTPAMLASIRGHGNVLRPILKASRISVNASASGSYGFQVTALMLAARYDYKHLMRDTWNIKGGITDTIVQLIDKGAFINVMDKATEGNGRTPILQAMHNDDFISMFYLVTGGADLSIQNHPVGKKPEQYLEVKLTSNGGILEETQQTEETKTVTVKKGPEWDKFGELIKISLTASKWKCYHGHPLENSTCEECKKAREKALENLKTETGDSDNNENNKNILSSQRALPFIGIDFMCNLYFEWRLLSVVYNTRGYGDTEKDTMIEDISKKYKITENYFNDIISFKAKLLKKTQQEKINVESMDLICFLLTCPKPILAHIQNFFIFDRQINTWLKGLDNILHEPSRNAWKDHWNNRLALKNQHVVKDQVNLSYGLRKYNNTSGRFDPRASYCFGMFLSNKS